MLFARRDGVWRDLAPDALIERAGNRVRARDANRANRIELVRVEQDFCFERLRRDRAAKAVRGNRVRDGIGAVCRDAAFQKDCVRAFSRHHRVVAATRVFFQARNVVQERRRVHDLRIRLFGARQAFREGEYAPDMIEIVRAFRIRVKRARLFNRDYQFVSPLRNDIIVIADC